MKGYIFGEYGNLKKILDWNNRIMSLLQRLPQYNKTNFSFTILNERPPNNDGLYYFFESGEFYRRSDERGQVLDEKVTSNIEEAVYWVLYDITWEYVIDYEAKHRIRYTDSRRQWIKLWQELFDIFGRSYSDMFQKYIAALLQKFPFDDTATCKLDLFEDYEEIAVLLKDTLYYQTSDWCRTIVDKMLTSYRDKYRGISNFDGAFEEMKTHINEIRIFLKNKNDKIEKKEIFQKIKHTESILQQYLRHI
ncbi:MAG: immunity 63 family protein [Treponema sp.]|nr:immunity 63 family protein [Treponema sp.]